MARNLNDLTGMAFGLLSVLHRDTTKSRVYWVCRCSCGTEKSIAGESLKKEGTRSCGCATSRFIRATKEKRYSLVNQRFGRLLVVWHAGYKKYGLKGRSYTLWECKCDCGNLTKVIASSLVSGKTQSCGCLFREKVRLEPGQAGFNIVFDRYKKLAEKRELKWELTEEQFKTLALGNCHYCGEPPKQVSRRQSDNGIFVYNGIDRLNSSLGYVIGNVVSCCGTHNKMKSSMSCEQFVASCESVVRHLNRTAAGAKA